MKSTFTWTLRDGRKAELKATYGCEMKKRTADADGIKVELEARPAETADTDLVFCVNGKQISHSWNVASWELTDRNMNGQSCKAIDALRVAFDLETAAKYEAWIAGVIEAGTSDEVKEYQTAQEQKKVERKIEAAKTVIRKAEAQKDIPTAREAERRLRAWNNVVNEGGEGYLPEIITLEEYEYAKETLRKLENR